METRVADPVCEMEQIWARRAEEMARVPPQEPEGGQIELLVVRLGTEQYAFEAQLARDIRPETRITPVPGVPDWVAGVTSRRGQILSVLDLARFLGLPGEPTAMGRPVATVSTPAMELVLLVDEILAVETLPLACLREPGSTLVALPDEYVQGVVAWGPGMLVILDLPSLLADQRLIIQQEVV